ncbi:DUF6588 family protein [Flammeovirga aprica]|uniref:Uncharacterized protein n=1 Tax=Flammeovirga aprica JL-4 TaxID=694437 RepID=A0A7X9RQS8_9BACT|nr:DUF6588 family protein [Flammeovirga aprica]NME67083.1 hypothetical protein [Flammeovirga aprica JL-4]
MKSLYLYIGLFFLSPLSYSQDVLSLFSTEGENAQKSSLELFNRYTGPLVESYKWAVGLGWNHTARPHRPIGFDLSFGSAIVFIPSDKLYYDVNGIEGVRIIKGSERIPTFFGSNTTSSVIGVKNDDGTEAIIPATQGVNIPIAPLPYLKFGLGIYKNTEIMGRVFPKVEYNGIILQMWGAGLKHNLIQWFFKEKSPFDLSIFGGYTQVEGNYPLEQSAVAPVKEPGNLNFITRGGDFELIMSKTFPLLTLYVNSGFIYSKNTTKFNGDYRLLQDENKTLNLPDDGLVEESELRTWKFGGGIMLKFGLVFLNGDYTFSNYHQINVGMGLTLK